MSHQYAGRAALSALGAVTSSGISAGVLSILLAVPALAQESASCQTAVQSVRTDFPANSQRLGHHGTVRVRLVVDSSGRATSAAVARSSGHVELDRAAVASVRKYWQFDVAGCSGADLAREQTVDVHFERAKSVTVSMTVDRKALARSRELAASGACQVERIDSETRVFACAAKESERRAAVQQAAR